MKSRKNSVPTINLSKFSDHKNLHQFGFPQYASPFNSRGNSSNRSPNFTRVKNLVEVRK